jgi:hypothetical protein
MEWWGGVAMTLLCSELSPLVWEEDERKRGALNTDTGCESARRREGRVVSGVWGEVGQPWI